MDDQKFIPLGNDKYRVYFGGAWLVGTRADILKVIDSMLMSKTHTSLDTTALLPHEAEYNTNNNIKS